MRTDSPLLSPNSDFDRSEDVDRLAVLTETVSCFAVFSCNRFRRLGDKSNVLVEESFCSSFTAVSVELGKVLSSADFL